MNNKLHYIFFAVVILIFTFSGIERVVAKEAEQVDLFCDHSQLRGYNSNHEPQEWNSFLVSIFPSNIIIFGSVFFDGVYEISSTLDSRLLVVASNEEKVVNINRYNGKFALHETSENSNQIKYLLDSKCKHSKALF